MSDTVESYLMRRQPTAARPLLGLTVLVVEDSRFASEAVRLLCLRSGARIRRADCLNSARRHLRTYRPAVVIVDLGLPDGSGEDLIQELAESSDPMELVLATSGDPDGRARAMAAGAMDFFEKPISSLASFQELILGHLPPEARPTGLRMMSEDQVVPDPIAYHDDLLHVADLLAAEEDPPVDYIAQFLSGIARSAGDREMMQAAQQLSWSLQEGSDPSDALQKIEDLIEAQSEKKAVV
ncbi:MAG: response regulator [Mangrovicoccus sp.]